MPSKQGPTSCSLSRISTKPSMAKSVKTPKKTDTPDTEEGEFYVEKILNHRVCKKTLELHIKWLNHPMSEASWEPVDNCSKSMLLIINYFSSRADRNPRFEWRTRVQHLLDSSDSEVMELWNSPQALFPLPTATKPLPPSPRKQQVRFPLPPFPPPPPSPLRDQHTIPLTSLHTPMGTTPRCPPVQQRSPMDEKDRHHRAIAGFGGEDPIGIALPQLPVPTCTSTSAAHPTCGDGHDPIADLLAEPPGASLVLTRFEVTPELQEVEEEIWAAIRRARRIPSSPISTWHPRIKSVWQTHLVELAKLLCEVRRAPSQALIFTCVYHILTAPGNIIGSLCDEVKSGHQNDSAEHLVNTALRKLVLGQEKKAFKLLCSNGIAPPSPEVLDALADLHPHRTNEIVPPVPKCPQMVIRAEEFREVLFKLAADESIAKDIFGWSPALMLECRGIPGGFFEEFCNFLEFFARNPGAFPPIAATLLSMGSLTPLHKVGAAERRRACDGVAPKVRPINSGTMFAKAALKAMLRTPASERAAKRVEPYQLGLSKRGCERIIHTARAAFELGWLIAKHDFVNGFNSISRQVLLDAHDRACPESTSLFNFFYTAQSSVCMFDEEGEPVSLSSEEGARQGCPAGTEAFCHAIDPVIRTVAAAFPGFIFKVTVDDIITLCPPLGDDWQGRMSQYGRCREMLKVEASKVGLSLSPTKGALLCPPACPPPDPDVKSLFPEGYCFTKEGVIIAGAPIGSDDYVMEAVKCKLGEARLKLAAAITLGNKNARAGHRIITSCFIKVLGYLSTTVPPEFVKEALHAFDEDVFRAFLDIICPENLELEGDRMERVIAKARLPAPHGCGLFATEDHGSAAWVASVVAS